MSLKEYKAKRNFKKTAEPSGKTGKVKGKNIFVIQKHHASHLHYDFRLELDGVLKSWAVPKGPSLNPKDKRLAVEVEDHPVDYANFEGEIPEGEYGGGHVIVWDNGKWIPPANAKEQLKKGKLEFELQGHKLHGQWVLVRTHLPGGKKNNWFLIKRNDDEANLKKDITENDESVLSGISLEALESEMTDKKITKKKTKARPRNQKKSEVLEFKDIKSPQLATLMDEPPKGNQWIHEIKFDGYRTICRKDKKKVQLLTRSGLDWSTKYKNLQKECEKLPVQSIVMDGEIVWIDKQGHSSFDGLQNALEADKSEELVYYVFDLLYLNGHDCREMPLFERKNLLKEVISSSDSEKIIYSHHWDENGASVFKSACQNKLEGIISKNIDAGYVSGRSKDWQKIKCTNMQEFVIGGYTLRETNELAALLMGAKNEEGEFQYLGKVGTGFGLRNHKMLLGKLKKLKAKESPFEVKSPKSKETIWVKPELVANIEFGAWTEDKILRHSAFKSLRDDKKAKDILVEFPASNKKSKAVKKIKAIAKKDSNEKDYEITHPDKIIYPDSGITKHDLAAYYDSIEKWIIPYIKNRPLALLRCPNGEGKACFFQKHIETDQEGILSEIVTSKLKKKKEEVLYIDSGIGLTELVQLGTLEIHARGGLYSEIDYANQIVFDFDPDPGVKFGKVKEAAFVLKDLLGRLKLKSFIKTSGGKGLHVHVPIAAIYDWDEIKNFSKSICDQMEMENPGKFTTNISKAKRKGKIFLDYLRNGYGASAVVPYSVRARPLAPVAFPITWAEAEKLKSPAQYTLKDVQKMLKKRKDPWAGFLKMKQKIKLLDQYKALK
ncbi:MAG: DNA ligase D [Bacteriovorax sp.]|nr:DNA ligase D [Bacteriovorax sp.]